MIEITSIASLAVFTSLIAACAVTAAPDSRPTAPETASASTSAVRRDEAADVTGTWAFDLAQSDPATAIRERCAASSADIATQASCWNQVAAEAKLEKIRFTKADDAGRATWTSFAVVDGNAETVFAETPITLSADGSGNLVARIAGKPTGIHADRLVQAKVDTMRIEIVDARTIALVDSRKGRLVYARE